MNSFSRNITGMGNAIDYYHYGDKYATPPILGEEFIRETTANVDRTIQVQSDLADQWQLNCSFSNKITRQMPVHSIPNGLETI